MDKLNVAIIGLGAFGEAFPPIYRAHPGVGDITLFDMSADSVARALGSVGGGARVAGSFEEILSDGSIDAVHLLTPIPLHEEQTVAVLDAGKHCACAVPMATSLDGIRRIAAAARRSGRNYMMMETTLYTYQFLFAKRMAERGEFGRIQFLRGTHWQNMAGWPGYWPGLPPMWYGTHAIAPMVALAGSPIVRAVCFGSGSMAPDLVARYGNPYPVECALFEFASGLKGEVTRGLFEIARVYQEGMFVYGSEKSFEWGFQDGDDPYVTTLSPRTDGWRGCQESAVATPMPNFCDGLPEEIRRFTVGRNYDPMNPQESLKAGRGGWHHGSHPHLVHEFVSSCLEGRKPRIDESLAGNITAAGLCAHESAMHNGAPVAVPGI